MKKRSYKTTIFYMIMGIILCGGIALILNYGIFTTKNYLAQYNGFILDNVKVKANDLSENLAYMNNTLMDIKMSEAVKTWSECDSWAQMHFQAIKVQKEIKRQTIYNNDLKYKIGITFLDERELVVSSEITSQKYIFFRDLGLDKNEVDEIYKEIKDGKQKFLIKQGREVDGQKYLHYFTKFTYNDKELLYIISINERNLLDLMKDDKGDYYIFNDEGILVQKEAPLYDIRAIHHKVAEKSLNDYDETATRKTKHYSYDGKKIIFEPISEFGWRLGYIYQPHLIEIRQLLMGMLYIMGIAISIGILIAKLTTERLYRPVNTMLEEIGGKNHLKEMDMSNEFEYISQHNKTIEATNDRLAEMIENNKGIIREKFYKELLNGIKAYKKEEYREYSLEKEEQRIVWIEFENRNQRLEDEQTFLVKQGIKSKSIAFKNIQYLNIDYKTCCLLIKGDLEINMVKKRILQIIEEVENDTDLKIKIFVGDIVYTLDQLHDACLRAKKAIEYKNSFPNKLIITQEDIDGLNFNVTTFAVRIENKIITNTLHGEEETLVLLDELIQENLMKNDKIPYHKKNFVLAIVVTLNRIFDQMSVIPQSYLQEYYTDYLALYDEYNEQIPSRIKTLFGFIIEQVKSQEVQCKQDMAAQMLDYIHVNYPDDIMLEDMAATLDISVKYCSVLFKRVTGENFKTVLNQYRIQKAKELLEQKGKKVSEVAIEVGFNSTNTFIRVFNKYVGMSPGTYQEQNTEGAL